MAESFNSLYRKYRPSTFKDVAGHKNIVEILETELKNGNFSHAYLFAGQRGTGKTSVARILAKAINCLDLQNGDPCNKCENCIAFNEGQFADIYEIDAASNNGVDEIRNIKNNVQTLPIVGKYKIYIIDEVHMLTKGAFNALLKTLEEPPAHVVFILATTEYDKIPATIISRCQSFSFKKISNKDMKDRLNFISQNEGFKLDDDAANEIYDISEGSLRDALNVLEQLMVVCDQTKEIRIEDIKKIFYVATKNEKIKVLKDILNKQSQSVIDYFEQAKKQGMDFNVFTLSLIKMIKEIIEYKLTGESKFLDVLSEGDMKSFENASIENLFNISDNLTEAYTKTKNSSASFDYILLSVLKSIKDKNIASPKVTETVQEDVSDQINNEGDGNPTPETEEKLEEENVVKEQPEDSDEDAFERFETAVLSEDMFNDNEEDAATYDQQVDTLEHGNDTQVTGTPDESEEAESNDEDSTITSFNGMDESHTPTVNQDVTDEMSKEVTDESIQEDNAEMDEPFDQQTIDLKESNDAIEEETEVIATNGTELFNKQVDLIVKDQSDKEISYLVDDLVNVLMGVLEVGSTGPRKEAQERLDDIFKVNKDNEFEDIAKANEFISVYKSRVGAADDNELVLVTESATRANLLNNSLTDPSFRSEFMEQFGKDYVVYAINESEWKQVKATFADLKKNGLLPEYSPIDFDEFYKKNTEKLRPDDDPRTNETLEKATQLFDMDDIKVSDK